MKVLMILQIFRKDFGTCQAPGSLDNCSVPIGDTKTSVGCQRGKHEVERHLLDGKTGPGGNESNGDLRGYLRATLSRGLDVEFLKDLNGESKVGSQKDLPGNRALFGLCLRRADGVQENIRINEGCHDDRALRVLPDQKLGSI